MNRRLYFLLPDKAHALALVNELVGNGIHHQSMHALAGQAVQLDGLPAATRRQNDDIGRHVETLLWNGNPVVFGLALCSLIALLVTSGFTAWLDDPGRYHAGHLSGRPALHPDTQYPPG